MDREQTPTATPEILSPARRGYLPNLRPPWRLGQSGNPSGRPRHNQATELCRELTPDAVETLKKNLKHKNGNVANMAAKIILEHAWGRPAVIDPDGTALAEVIREQMVTEVRMVIVEPNGTERVMPSRAERANGGNAAGQGRGADPCPPRGAGGNGHFTGTSEA